MVDEPAGGDLSAERIVAALGTDRTFGHPVQYFGVGVSAESLALGWARKQDAPEGALVVMDVELSARGRRGVTWVSAAGRSLAFALVLRPALPPAGEGLLWLLASLAAAEGVEAATGLDVGLKWPNDLLVDERGVGGVRIDAQLGPGVIETAVLTVRLNVGLEPDDFPDGLRPQVTSLAMEMEGDAPPRLAVLEAILDRLDQWYEAGVPALLEGYKARCGTLGTRVRALLMPSGEAVGTAADVDGQGGLVIKTPSGHGSIGVDRLKRLEAD